MSQPPSPPDAARVGPRVDPRGRVWLKAMTRPQLLAWAGDTLGARPAQADNLWAGLHRRLAADVSELDLIPALQLALHGDDVPARFVAGEPVFAAARRQVGEPPASG